MKVFLDERPLEVKQPTLAAALDAGRAEATAKGRIIVEVKVNGRAIADSELDAPSVTPDPDGEIRLVTAEPKSLVWTTFMDVSEAMEDEVRPLQAEAAGALQAGKFEEAFEALGEAMAVWDTLRRVIEQGPALLGINLEDMKVDVGGAGSTVQGHLNELADLLSRIKSALEAQDWSTLADDLEGDLDQAAARWSEILKGLAAGLSKGR